MPSLQNAMYQQNKYALIVGGVLALIIAGMVGWWVLNAPMVREAPPIRYQNTEYGFSFYLPPRHAASAFSEGEGQTVLVRNFQGVIVGQLHVSKTSVSGPLDSEFLRRDLKDTELFDVQTISIATSSAVVGTAFSFEDPTSRATSEVWFIRPPVLYQWTIAAGQEALVRGIIDSMVWR